MSSYYRESGALVEIIVHTTDKDVANYIYDKIQREANLTPEPHAIRNARLAEMLATTIYWLLASFSMIMAIGIMLEVGNLVGNSYRWSSYSSYLYNIYMYGSPMIIAAVVIVNKFNAARSEARASKG